MKGISCISGGGPITIALKVGLIIREQKIRNHSTWLYLRAFGLNVIIPSFRTNIPLPSIVPYKFWPLCLPILKAFILILRTLAKNLLYKMTPRNYYRKWHTHNIYFNAKLGNDTNNFCELMTLKLVIILNKENVISQIQIDGGCMLVIQWWKENSVCTNSHYNPFSCHFVIKIVLLSYFFLTYLWGHKLWRKLTI